MAPAAMDASSPGTDLKIMNSTVMTPSATSGIIARRSSRKRDMDLFVYAVLALRSDVNTIGQSSTPPTLLRVAETFSLT